MWLLTTRIGNNTEVLVAYRDRKLALDFLNDKRGKCGGQVDRYGSRYVLQLPQCTYQVEEVEVVG